MRVMQYTPFVWFNIVAALFLGLAGWYGRRFPHTPAIRSFRAVMYLGVAWTLFYGASLLMTQLSWRIWTTSLMYIPTRLGPVACLLLALEYSARGTRLKNWQLALILIIPVAGIVGALTSPWHELFRHHFVLDSSGPVTVMHYQTGPLFRISAIYGNALAALAPLILLVDLVRGNGSRRNTAILLSGIILPLVANVLFNMKLGPIPGYNFAPSVLVMTAAGYYLALLRLQLFGIVPIARSLVLEHMRDAVLVFDDHERLVDYNTTALSWFHIHQKEDSSRNLALVTAPWAGHFKNFFAANSPRAEHRIAIGGIEHWVQFDRSTISSRSRKAAGTIVIVRDIDDIKAREDEIRALVEQKDVLIREVHHRIKNNMAVISGILALHAARVSSEETKMALGEAKSRIHSMMVLYEKLYCTLSGTNITMDAYLGPLVEKILSSLDTGGRIALEYRFPACPFNSAVLFPLGIILNELVSNACKYAFEGIGDPQIHIDAVLEGDRINLIFTDNGVGFSAASDGSKSESFGLQLINSMTAQLDGTITKQDGPGTRWLLSFPCPCVQKQKSAK